MLEVPQDRHHNIRMLIESRFDRLEYLQDTTTLGGDPENLLLALVAAMSDREFHETYMFICRMHDIEPDMDKAFEQFSNKQALNES